MQRSRVASRVLLATLLPAYLLVQTVAVRECRSHGPWWFPFSVTGAQGSSSYPLVARLNGPGLPVRVGDQVLRMGEVDLRGLSRAAGMHAAAPLLRDGRLFEVELAREGARFELQVAPVPDPYWWWLVAAHAGLALCATFLLLRAPHWHLARRFFGAALATCILRAADLGATLPVLWPVWIAAQALALGLFSSCFLDWSEPSGSRRSFERAIPWGIGLAAAASSAVSALRAPTGLWPNRAQTVVATVFVLAALLSMARAYRRSGPLERRQLRFVLYGAYVSVLPLLLMYVLLLANVEFNWPLWDAATGVFVLALPLGIAVSVVGYRYLDIDRLISATASYTVLAVAVVGGALVGLPRLASAVSRAAGIDPETGRIAGSLALAALLVPAHRALRPWLDRRLFAQHFELARAFERQLAELSGCRGVGELAERTGAGIDALLRPESLASYARSGEAFTPVFVRGRAAPPAFEAESTLVSVLETRGTLLAARTRELGPFERAALETLGAEVVVPVRQAGSLVAFTCLGAKRSGDIYTPTDLALLAAVGERCSEVLLRLDANAVAAEARELQAALRRYVPGAVARGLQDGRALQPAEREVTVLFVDLRGYTSYTEERRPTEVFATLNEHTLRVSGLVEEGGGSIVEFNGDGMMAVFGAPDALTEKERRAVEVARRIVETMPGPLVVAVGIATGSAFVGSIRSSDRLIWTAVGNTTNLASRLQALSGELGASIAIDATTRERAGYACADFVLHQDVAIRGRTERFEIFALPS